MNKKEKMDKIWDSFLPFYLQWYWDTGWKGKKYKALYHGPRIDWMYLMEESGQEKDTNKKD